MMVTLEQQVLEKILIKKVCKKKTSLDSLNSLKQKRKSAIKDMGNKN